ncbi:MAG: PIG-L family deacetylase [Acidimicrobiia bacterium]|nr:PIG-L family deacetylase [Acidimicrobiia bacterium]
MATALDLRWIGPALDGNRFVVVAPHPDDEVLMAGGAMRWAQNLGRAVLILAVSDGEASHRRSARVDPEQLRTRRATERAEALCRLGLTDVEVQCLRVPDGDCASSVEDIATVLRGQLRPSDAVVGPAAEDRHPDHVAVARAMRMASGGRRWWEAPTWALVHGTDPPPTCQLDLGRETWRAKIHAMAAFESQLVALGPDECDGPVVHAHELRAMLRPVETFAAKTA